jgi:hypothetical protein
MMLLAPPSTAQPRAFDDAWSCACPDAERVAHGSNAWWGRLLITNHSDNSATHPYACALGCGHTYAKKTANATKVREHITGDGNQIKRCTRATPVDQQLARAKQRSPRTEVPPLGPPDPKRARVLVEVGAGGEASEGSSSLQQQLQLPADAQLLLPAGAHMPAPPALEAADGTVVVNDDGDGDVPLDESEEEAAARRATAAGLALVRSLRGDKWSATHAPPRSSEEVERMAKQEGLTLVRSLRWLDLT